VLPSLNKDGNLPSGIHWAEWPELGNHFGSNPHRRRLLSGLEQGLKALKRANCRTVYVDGSFVTSKEFPEDFDACWDTTGIDSNLLDPVFLDFSRRRAAQKARFGGEFFPAQTPAGVSGRTFLEFFQIDKVTGDPKGIVALDLERWQP